MNKFRGKMVMRESERLIICYSQFDMGNKYKIYKKYGESFEYVISFDNITSAYKYYDMIFNK